MKLPLRFLFLALLASTLPALAPALASTDGARLSYHLHTGIPGQQVFFASELREWDAQAMPMLESSPGEYGIDFPSPWLAELRYKFVVDGQWIADPSNSVTEPDGHGGMNSVTYTGFADDPLLSPQPGVPAWASQRMGMTDNLGQPRVITVLKPAFDIPGKRKAIAYFQDGGDYLQRTGVANLLANLSQQKDMPQITGVFIPPVDRNREYELSDDYADFVGRVVYKEVERRLGQTYAPAERMLIGPSLGGLITLYTGLKYPEVFGLVASQSGSLWFHDEKVLSMISNAASSGNPPRLFLEVGIFEDPDMLAYNRKAFEAGKRASLDIYYEEYPSTHDWTAWRNRLTQIFRHLMAR